MITERLTNLPPCAIVELPRRGLCYVISVSKHLPLSRAQFRQQRQGLLNQLVKERSKQLGIHWWSSRNIRRRTAYRKLQPGQEIDLADESKKQTPEEDAE